jgi:tRNA (mo5U34)-methyltransferase
VFGPSRREREELVATVPWWWHSIDVGRGVVTPGQKGAETPLGSRAFMEAELASLALPDLHGKTVLDIGALDGFYSFEAERRGAARVVALEYPAWVEPPDDPDRLPPAGRAGFDVAHHLLQSRVQPVLADLMKLDPAVLGPFDVVLFLGVLYHLEDPLGGMRRVAALTRELAVIESQAIAVAGAEEHALLAFFPGGELNDDPSNWFVPNLAALRALCIAAGFSRADAIVGPPEPPAAAPPAHYRAVVHAHV